jgi:hypothetical protein
MGKRLATELQLSINEMRVGMKVGPTWLVLIRYKWKTDKPPTNHTQRKQ